MAENPHYRELLQIFNAFEVEYLIVGGFAVMKYGEPRYTKDLDVWVHNSPQIPCGWSGRLSSLVLPSSTTGLLRRRSPTSRWCMEFGIAPVKIDILTEITGVEFPDAWRGRRVASTFFGVPVHFISVDDLVTNKQALGRSSDLKDLNRNPKSKPQDK